MNCYQNIVFGSALKNEFFKTDDAIFATNFFKGLGLMIFITG